MPSKTQYHMKSLFMFFLSIIPIVVFSQNGPLDTVFVKRDLGKIKMDTFYIKGGIGLDQ